MTPAARKSIWPAVYPAMLELIRAHRSTLIFVNNRRLAERLALRLNELAEAEVARAHHGSLAAEQRVIIEEELKAGTLPALVATSSLELGIDMGAVDLVIQVESPRSVARGIQRVGRSGHQVGGASRGRIFPKYRGDLLECAAVVSRMREAAIEETRVPRLPLDVLAQQIVATVANDPWSVDDLLALARGAYPFAELTREQLDGVLDMLAGRYPSDEFAELAPRVVWDRTDGTVRGRGGARQLAVQNAGTIPDRGPLRGVPRRRQHARRRAGRGDGLRGAHRADVHARRLDAGGSRRSPATACWSPPRRAFPAPCRSGKARASAARWSSGVRSASSRASSWRRGRTAPSRGSARSRRSTSGPP